LHGGEVWNAEPGAHRATQGCRVLKAVPLLKLTAIGIQKANKAGLLAVAIESNRSGVQVDESIRLFREHFRGGVCRGVKMHSYGKCGRTVLCGQAAQYHQLGTRARREKAVSVESEINRCLKAQRDFSLVWRRSSFQRCAQFDASGLKGSQRGLVLVA
jgi:hypothetical protein